MPVRHTAKRRETHAHVGEFRTRKRPLPVTLFLVHPTGNANVRALLRAVARYGPEAVFWTAIALPPILLGLVRRLPRLQRELARRTFAEIPYRRVRMRPARDLARLLAERLGRRGRPPGRGDPLDAVCAALDQAVARALARDGRVRAVYAYEDGALATFEAARRKGIGGLRTARALLAGLA